MSNDLRQPAPLTANTADQAAVIRIESAVPTFLVPDVGRTARWYAEHLGFHTRGVVPATSSFSAS